MTPVVPPGQSKHRNRVERDSPPDPAASALQQTKALLDRGEPACGWRRLLSDTFLAGGATLFGQVLGALTAVLLRVLLSPVQIGIWQGLKLALSYGNYSGLGVSKAVAREVSLASGKKEPPDLSGSINLAFTVNTLTSLAYSLALVGVAAACALRHGTLSGAWAIGFLAIAALTMLQRFVSFRVTLLRAGHEFRKTSQLSIQEGLLTLSATAVFVWLLGLTGLYLATAFVMLASMWFLHRAHGHRFRFAWETQRVRQLMSIGSPLLAAGIVSSLFRSLDKIFLLTTSSDGEFQLGCYSTALLVAMQLYGLANILGGVCGPRLAQTYGMTGNDQSVAKLNARLTELMAVGLALPAALALCVGPCLLYHLLPDYRSGLPALVPMVWGTLALGLALPAQHCLVAWNGGRTALRALAIGTALAVCFDAMAVMFGGGLFRIAIATMLANFSYLALMLWLTVRGIPRADLMQRVRPTLLALLPVVLATSCLSWADAASWSWAMTAAVVVAGCWCCVLLWGRNRFKWRELLSTNREN